MKPNSLFATWPYFAFGSLVAIVFLRYLVNLRRIDEMASRVKAWEAFGGGMLWKFSLLLLLAGHLAGLFFPQRILSFDQIPVRLYLLEGLGFAFGLLALFGWAKLIWKHLGQSSGLFQTEVADTVFLALLLVAILSGLLISLIYRWGSSWGVATLTPYVLTLLRGRPNYRFVAEMPFLVQLHVFSSFVGLAVLPFTRLGSVLVVALHRVLAFAGNPALARFKAMEDWLRRHNPTAWIWPVED